MSSRNDIDGLNAPMMALEEVTDKVTQDEVRAASTAVHQAAQKNVRIGVPFDVQCAPSIRCCAMDFCPTSVTTGFEFPMDSQIKIGDMTVLDN